MTRDLEQFADDDAQAKFAENQELARRLRVRSSLLKDSEAELAVAKDELETLQRELALYESDLSARPKWLASPKRDGKHHGTLIAFLSDTHWGETVDPRELDGFNAYSLEIAEARLKRFFERTIRVARNYFAGVEYDGIVLPLGGDLVSGDIHEELVETNEASTYETILWAVPRLAAGIELFAAEFGKVHVVSAPGNHGRNTLKPRAKRNSANNADTLIARLVARDFVGREDVTFEVPESTDASFPVYDKVFSVEHGEVFQKGFAGSAEIGPLGPVKRGTARKRSQLAVEGRRMDYNLVAHFHQYVPAVTQGFVMNGSVKGYDEFARRFHYKPEEPQQALMVCTPEHGVTIQAPVFVGDRKSEGW